METNQNQTNPPLCLPVFMDPQTMETDQEMTRIWPQTTSSNPKNRRMLNLKSSKDQIYDGANRTFYIFVQEFLKLLKILNPQRPPSTHAYSSATSVPQ